MRSLVKIGSISEDRIKSFKKSIKTISTELSVDYYKVCNGGMNKDDFLNRYGHLRPSSYDIMSPTYLEREYLFDGNPSKPALHEILNYQTMRLLKLIRL